MFYHSGKDSENLWDFEVWKKQWVTLSDVNSKIEDSGEMDQIYRDSHATVDILCNIESPLSDYFLWENPKDTALIKALRNFLTKGEEHG